MSELKNLDWPQIIERLKKNATSELAKLELEGLQVLESEKACEQSFNNIFSAQIVLSFGQRPFMESLDLTYTWLPRLQKNAILKTLELKDIRHFCIETIALKEVLQNSDSEWSEQLRNQLMNSSEALSAIDQIMTTDGSIRSDASELLYKLNEEKKTQSQQIQKILDRLVKTFEMEPLLQDRYVTNREGRWVLPVKSGMQHQMEGIIHASSHSKQTVFMEPQEIIPINNRLRQVEQEIEQEIERLLKELSEYLSGQYQDFLNTKDTLLFCDKEFAKAQLSVQLEASTCEFTKDEIVLNEIRHPLLLINNQSVIPNTVEMNPEQRILILSGPNAGGKTVLLKSIGLASHMARCGLPICAAPGSKIPFFEKIFIGVGDSQSVDEHLSTFAAHLKILNEATQAKGFKNLLLIDEICGSTDPEEGSALAKSFIKSYADNKVFAVITSHLGGLKKDWEDFSGVINGSLEFDKNKGPTYQFLKGIPGQSLAIQTAKRVGVDDAIIDRAFQFLSPEHRKYQENLVEVEKMSTDLIHLREELHSQKIQFMQEKNKYVKMQQQLEQEKGQILDKILKEAEEKLEKMLQEINLQETFKKHENIRKLKSEMPEVIKSSSISKDHSFKINSAEEFTKRYPPGSKVFVPQLNSDGVIQGRPSSKGEVPVLSRSMRLVLPWQELKPPNQAQNPTHEVIRKTSHFQISHGDTDRLVDVRGLNIEEATAQVDLQLDIASLNKEDRIKIIHGHGTEALKRAIRTYLSRSLYVKKWKAGTKDTGGDGVTWAELKD
ncbi:MAG: Smr/MutS family protein [Bdellovibrionaceae bacterium]|nr:Smr/MutS family protein [Pseudobdellovibrionaceae bacterium]